MFFLGIVESKAIQNINEAQLRQRESYAKRHLKADTKFNPGDKVLLKNLRRNDRKGGWSLMPWIGPFTIESISDKNTCVLRRGDKLIKTHQHLKNIKKFFERTEDISQDPNDEVIVSDENVITVKKSAFRPVSKLWMANKCLELNVPITQKHKCVAKKSYKRLSKPKQTIDVIGDGNCWFRCISVWLTNSEEYHELIRSSVYKVFMFIFMY